VKEEEEVKEKEEVKEMKEEVKEEGKVVGLGEGQEEVRLGVLEDVEAVTALVHQRHSTRTFLRQDYD